MFFVIFKNRNSKNYDIAYSLENEILSMYVNHTGIEYKKDNNQYVIIEKEYVTSLGTKINYQYYEINNINEIKSKFTDKMFEHVKKVLDIEKIGEKYYIVQNSKNNINYTKIDLKQRYILLNKAVYTMSVTMCERKYTLPNGNCSSEEYLYTIDKPFILVKENGKWKVDEYTSIFEFDDSEIK